MTTKQRVSEEQHRRVLDLRRRLSLREVAIETGLPLGTVKTLVSRSGAFRDNLELQPAAFPPKCQHGLEHTHRPTAAGSHR